MSYDLKLVGGDISFGPDGNLATVEGIAKLAQDVSKVMLTPIGSDPGNMQYGTKLRQIIGKPLDFSTYQGLVAKTVAQGLLFLQSLQTAQSSQQTLTYEEMIGSIDAIAVLPTASSSIEVQVQITSVAGQRQVFAQQLSGKSKT